MNQDTKGFIVLIMLCVVVLAGTYLFLKERCNQQSISFSDHKFGLFSGCMVKHNYKWIPLTNIRGFNDH